MYLSIVIPAYNETKNIEDTLKDVDAYLSKQDYEAEIIVVDDASKDDTVAKVKELQNDIPNLHILEADSNQGKGAVVQRGILASKGEYVVFLDADNATRIHEIEKAWEHIKKSKTIAIGSRALLDSDIVIPQPVSRIILGRLGNKVIQLLLLPGIRDTQCGFKCFRTDEAKKLFSELETKRWGFDFEILARARHAGYNIVEIPIQWRNDDESSVGRGDAVRTIKELLRIRSQRRNWPKSTK